MEYRKLGQSGLEVSAIGLGTNRFGNKVDQAGVKDILDAALDNGVNFIDTANVYGAGQSEETIGVAIQGRRDDFIIATKVWGKMGDGPNERGSSRKHIMQAVEASLSRLQTDYIDLYQLHRWDPDTPLEETLRTLDDLIGMGKIRYYGTSNFSAWQLAHTVHTAKANGWAAPVSEQPHYHMLERSIETEIQPACDHFGIGILPYFPLAGGFLTGKYQRGQEAPAGSRGETSPYVQRYMTDENYDVIEALTGFAAEREHTLGDLAHAWLLAQPAVSCVISGATKVEHVEMNAKGADWALSPEDIQEISTILTGEPSDA